MIKSIFSFLTTKQELSYFIYNLLIINELNLITKNLALLNLYYIMELHLKIIGFILMVLAVVHAVFPKYFDWKTELASLNLINRQLMYVHTFFIALMVFLMGLLCFLSSDDIVHTKLGQKIALGMAVFWFTRLFFQFFVYSSSLWKGKLFETIVHIAFTVLWSYLSVVFFMIWISELNSGIYCS